jgi:hypothetical protein
MLAVPSSVLLASAAQGLGDALCGLPALRALRRLHPHARLGYLTKYPDVVPTWAAAIKFSGPEPFSTWGDQGAIDDSRDYWRETWLEPQRAEWGDIRDLTIWRDTWGRDGGRLGYIPLPMWYSRLAGVDATPGDYRNVLDITDSHRARAAQLVAPQVGPYVIVQGGPCHAAHWVWRPETRWPIIESLLASGVRVFGLSGSDGNLPRGTQIIRSEPVRAGAAIIEGARLYVGADTGTSWLAVLCTQTPAVVIVRPEMHNAGSFVLFGDKRVQNVSNAATDSEKIALIKTVLAA